MINDGIAMDFARAYALGLYSQRCGTNNAMPYTRFTRGVPYGARQCAGAGIQLRVYLEYHCQL